MMQAGNAVIVAMALVACAGCAAGEAQNAPQPYKLGMFQEGARTFVGMVVGDSLVVDLSRASVNAPATLHELIARWDQPTADRLGRLAGEAQRQAPSFAFQLSAVKVLPPISDPDAILMAARNYAEHANEMAQAGRTAGTTTVIDEKVRSGIPGLWSSSAERSAAEPVSVSEAEVVARCRRRHRSCCRPAARASTTSASSWP